MNPLQREYWNAPVTVDSFDPQDLYCDPLLCVWESEGGLTLYPSYYPVFRYQNYYSHSPVPLIHLKGTFRPDQRYITMARLRQLPYISTNRSIDREIRRVGAPRYSSQKMQEPREYIEKVAKALKQDLAAVESKLHDYTMVILCGGKDSLNLLLVPWKNPVLVVSAEPNYPLVREFIKRNHLGYKCIRLDESGADKEVGRASLGALDLKHFRWINHLRRIAEENKRKVCFISGQLGDVVQTPYWQKYNALHQPTWLAYFPVFCGGWRVRNLLRSRHICVSNTNTQRYAREQLYWRGAMWQGMYTSVMRTVLRSPVISGYHGSAFQDVLSTADLQTCVQSDIRPNIGSELHGQKVWYPDENPGPHLASLAQHVPMRRIIQSLKREICGR